MIHEPDTQRPWFLTLSKRQFFYDAPEAYGYSAEEIAHALANICRFGAHLPKFYSVAEHSVHVCATVHRSLKAELEAEGGKPPARRLAEIRGLLRAALMHDAAEAFLGDMPRPMKYLPALTGYRDLSKRVELAIFRCLEIEEWHDHPEIKRADVSVLRAEKEQLRGDVDHRGFDIDRDVEAADVLCMSLGPTRATELFMRRWEALR